MYACSDLHADDGVDEKEHGDEQADIGQGLEGLHEGPQENPDGVTLPQQFDQTGSSEKFQKTHVDRINKLEKGQENSIYVSKCGCSCSGKWVDKKSYSVSL